MVIRKIQQLAIFGMGFLLSSLAWAQSSSGGGSSINIDQMLANIQEQIPYLVQFVTGFAYIVGFFFIFNGLYYLREYGEARTMMSSHTDLRKPISAIITGACLIYLPTAVSIGFVTIYGDNSVMAYPEGGTGWDEMAETIVDVVYFIGGVAFVRGLIKLNRATTSQQQPGELGKALAHIVGGILAMNIVGVTNILFTTLGIE